MELLQNSTFKFCDSIIVYCTRQQETERIAQLLRTCLQSIPNEPESEIGIDSGSEFDSKSQGKSTITRKRKNGNSSTKGNKRRKVDWSADCYHAGMQASRRRRVQSEFMSGGLRIVVATVAFGMGLNKADVRAIIHYNLPKSFESFVQEIGRAGRDGLPAYCHVFLDKQVRVEVALALKLNPHRNVTLFRKIFLKIKHRAAIFLSCVAMPTGTPSSAMASSSW